MKKRAERIAKLVAAKTGRVTKVVEVVKNNVKCYGVGIETNNKGTFAIAYFDEKNCYSDEQEADEIVAALGEEVLCPNIDVEKIESKEYILENVFPCFIGQKGNEKLLEEHANIRFLDMAIVFRVMVKEGKRGSFLLTNSHVEEIKSNVPEIFDIARKNMVEKHKVKIIPVEYAILHDDDPINDVPETECGMAVMTNKDNYYGANSFLRKDLLKKYADKIGKNLYIIPSSVHELLIVPKGHHDIKFLRNMVYVANIEVIPEYILSYSVYEYNREHNEISVAP